MTAIKSACVNVPAQRPKILRSGEQPIVRDDLFGLLAHDLKTPLAAIAMNLDFALTELERDLSDGLRSALDDSRQANARAIRIVSDMADAVGLALGDRRPTFTDVVLAQVVEAVVVRATGEASGRGVPLAWKADETVVRADFELVSRALDRLVERALRHARRGSRIDIHQHDATVEIRVDTLTEASDPTGRTLATYFAEAAMRAQGGTVRSEADGSGALVYSVSL